MAAMSLTKRRPARRTAKKTIRPSNGSARHSERGQEFLSFLTVPTASTIGSSLYTLEVNPTQFPRLGVFASQYKQWKGDVTLKVESLGNAFATSSVSLAFIPDPDVNELPSDPTSLLRVINSAPSQRNLHLQSQGSASVVAPWKLSTNPWKFVQDTDVSDRANGVFVIVSNGSPGAVDVPLKVSVSYNVQFQGNTYSPLEGALANVIQALYGTNNSLSDTLFQPTSGAFNYVVGGSGNRFLTLTYPSGTVSNKYIGNWTPLLPSLPNAAIVLYANYAAGSATAALSRNTLTQFSVSATQAIYQFADSLTVPTLAGSFIVQPRILTQ